MKPPRFSFRLTENEMQILQSRAAAAELSPSEFARQAIFGRQAILTRKPLDAKAQSFSIDVVGVRLKEMTERLIYLEELLGGLTQKTDRAEAASVAAVVSAAMLRDNGSIEDDDLVTKMIAGHIDQAFVAVPSVLNKRARSR